MRHGSSATIAAFTVGLGVWFMATILFGISVGLLAGGLAAGAAWLAVTVPDRMPSKTPAGIGTTALHPAATSVKTGRVIDVDEQQHQHHTFGHQVVLTVAIEAADGVHVVEMRGRRRVGIISRGHEVVVPPGRPGRVRRAHRIDNITLGSPVQCH